MTSLQSGATAPSSLLRSTLALNAALELGGVAIALAAALDFAAQDQLHAGAAALVLAGLLAVTAVYMAALALQPRYQPVGLLMIINAASGLVAFMLIAAGQIDPVSSPLAGLTGLILLGLAATLFLELRKVRV